MAAPVLGAEQKDIQSFFFLFVESEEGKNVSEGIDKVITEDKLRLFLNINELREYDENNKTVWAERLQSGPNSILPFWEMALQDIIARRTRDVAKQTLNRTYHIAVEGSVGANRLSSPRELSVTFLNQLVMVDGIITKLSVVRPKLVQSVHYCPATEAWSKREYRDELTPNVSGKFLPTVNIIPKKDRDDNPLQTEYGLCHFVDHQVIILQELPEHAPVGLLPRHVEVVLEDDLVDAVKPGDRVRISGTYLARTQRTGDIEGIKCVTTLLSNHVAPLNAQASRPTLSTEDLTAIKNVAREKQRISDDKLLQYMSTAVAPTLYGLAAQKQALLLMLLGGEERGEGSSRRRGDINILLVGDPSVGKSQLLRFVMKVAPLSVHTTGKGATGVGLTAAVVTEDSERSLVPGAMVLGDRGIVCIDEFDKMNDNDRVMMHEAMEQGSVSIAKAGIHATLNSRCSVLAAANPIYGKLNKGVSGGNNIGLPESLQSRFDLIFFLYDQGDDPEHNRAIAHFVLANHIQAPTKREKIHDEDEQQDGIKKKKCQITATFNGRQIVSHIFLKKYIQYAKDNIHPVLAHEATKVIVDQYVDLRERTDKDEWCGCKITARVLESLIRLATAHAKLRLSETVEACDANIACNLFKSTLPFSDFNAETDGDGAGRRVFPEDDDFDDFSRDRGSPSQQLQRSESDMLDEEDESHQKQAAKPKAKPKPKPKGKGAKKGEGMSDKEKLIRKLLAKCIDNKNSITLDTAMEYMQASQELEGLGGLTAKELEPILEELDAEEVIMWDPQEEQIFALY